MKDLAFALVWALYISASCLFAQEGPESSHSVGLVIGYKKVDVGGYKYIHNTHKDDKFLTRSNVTGSAGTTEIGDVNAFAIGLRLLQKLPCHFRSNVDICFLGIKDNRAEKQNVNDNRQPENGAFIYSKAKNGYFGAIGLTYEIQNIYIGCDYQITRVRFESGWDRFNKDEKVKNEWGTAHCFAPKIGWHNGGGFAIEGTLPVGKYRGFGVSTIFYF